MACPQRTRYKTTFGVLILSRYDDTIVWGNIVSSLLHTRRYGSTLLIRTSRQLIRFVENCKGHWCYSHSAFHFFQLQTVFNDESYFIPAWHEYFCKKANRNVLSTYYFEHVSSSSWQSCQYFPESLSFRFSKLVSRCGNKQKPSICQRSVTVGSVHQILLSFNSLSSPNNVHYSQLALEDA